MKGGDTSRATVPPELVTLQHELYRTGRGRSGPVQGLLPWLVDGRNLNAAWQRVSTADGAATPGLDGVTCRDIAPRVDGWLDKLAKTLSDGDYTAAGPRYVDVPKANGTTTRRLGILTVRDRVVHAAVKQVLEPLLEPAFLPHSFGFRPGRSVPAALGTVLREFDRAGDMTRPITLATALDVRDCFEHIDHCLIMRAVGRYVSDESFLKLIAVVLAAGGQSGRRWFGASRRGLVQGSALSPLLCNLYLHPVDLTIATRREDTGGAVAGYRYADDLLLAACDQRQGRELVRLVGDTLKRLRMTFKARPRRLISLDEGVTWLGVSIRREMCPWNDRYEFRAYVPARKVESLLETLDAMTQPPSDRVGADAFNLSRWIVSVNEQLRSWREAYVFTENAPRVFAAIDVQARRCVGRLIRQLTRLRGRQLYETYQLRLPRGFWTWEVDGVRLACLSALAPRAARNLIRRPAWQHDSSQHNGAVRPAASARRLGHNRSNP